jgi:hypothetical protein
MGGRVSFVGVGSDVQPGIIARLMAGSVDHAELAGLFVAFLPKQVWGDRDQVLLRLRERYPTPASLAAFLRDGVGSFIVEHIRTVEPCGEPPAVRRP